MELYTYVYDTAKALSHKSNGKIQLVLVTDKSFCSIIYVCVYVYGGAGWMD